jgi:hypothetical protein
MRMDSLLIYLWLDSNSYLAALKREASGSTAA